VTSSGFRITINTVINGDVVISPNNDFSSPVTSTTFSSANLYDASGLSASTAYHWYVKYSTDGIGGLNRGVSTTSAAAATPAGRQSGISGPGKVTNGTVRVGR
jgi:hypothetical protein